VHVHVCAPPLPRNLLPDIPASWWHWVHSQSPPDDVTIAVNAWTTDPHRGQSPRQLDGGGHTHTLLVACTSRNHALRQGAMPTSLLSALLPCCRVAVLPCCRVAVLPCCRVAVAFEQG